jgi:hypothetical protein
MELAIGWLVTALVLALLATFAAYLVGLRALPTDERPRTDTYDRFGALIGRRENPDYHENPGETEAIGENEATPHAEP